MRNRAFHRKAALLIKNSLDYPWEIGVATSKFLLSSWAVRRLATRWRFNVLENFPLLSQNLATQTNKICHLNYTLNVNCFRWLAILANIRSTS